MVPPNRVLNSDLGAGPLRALLQGMARPSGRSFGIFWSVPGARPGALHPMSLGPAAQSGGWVPRQKPQW